jgi:hypothetical protein
VQVMSKFEQVEKSLKKRDLKTKADAFFEVGEKLKYEYEGAYDRSSIEEFFDGLAEDLMLKADSME